MILVELPNVQPLMLLENCAGSVVEVIELVLKQPLTDLNSVCAVVAIEVLQDKLLI
jgi:hypothetical protein